MTKRDRTRADSSDTTWAVLPLFSVAFTAITLLNLMRIAFSTGSPLFLWMWAPDLTPIHISVIAVVKLIAFLGAALLVIIAYGASFPSGLSGNFLRTALFSFAALMVAYVLILDSGGRRMIQRTESAYEKFKYHEGIRLEGADEIKEMLDALQSP